MTTTSHRQGRPVSLRLLFGLALIAVTTAATAQTHELLPPVSDEPLTASEQAGLELMREEEKLARDVYSALYEIWGIRVFSNIAVSEQRHMDTMAVLLDRYDVADPVASDVPGVFENPRLQSLYDELVERGSGSAAGALTVGATIEDLDIYDLTELMADSSKDDILAAYQNLVDGSHNHLRAFLRQLDRYGASYAPQHISPAEFGAIVG